MKFAWCLGLREVQKSSHRSLKSVFNYIFKKLKQGT